ncbi:hypothetical protein FACS1894188_12190 [Clostridia bacterium]|nr:hypothetical protein FACS1894188_12190 [Clostridia bacterium]
MTAFFFQIKKDDQLIAKLRFLDNNSLLFLSDAEMGCIRADTSKEYWALPISNEISKFAVADKCIVLGYGAAIPGRESGIPFGTLKIYNFDMAEVGSHEFGTDIIYLKQSGGAFTAGILGRYIMFGGDGKFLWEYTPTDDAKEIVPLENTNTVLSVSNIGAAVLKRSR